MAEEEKRLNITEGDVQEYSSNQETVRLIRSQFPRLNKKGATKLIRELLYQNPHIKIKDIITNEKTFRQYNISKIQDDEFKIEVIKTTRALLVDYLLKDGRDIQYLSVNDEKQTLDGIEFYKLDKHTTYEKIRKLTCDEGGDVDFRYDFDKPDVEMATIKNTDKLQLMEIQILSTAVKFDYPIENLYSCILCNGRTRKKAYETASTRGKILCQHIRHYTNPQTGDSKSKICSTSLLPDEEISLTKSAFYYDIGYEDDEGNKYTVGAISFNKYTPGFYECVLFKVRTPRKTELFHLMDIKHIENNKFDMPEKIQGTNYLFTLQQAFDKFIQQQTGMEIYGMFSIKVALILQALCSVLGFRLLYNIQIVGDSSTGKSTILKYYGFLINNQFNLSTNGLSISVPALRGTKQVITLMGKDQKIITVGYLGTFKSIHIDEAGENRDLIQNLKTFLLEDNYGYDKAGATGTFNKRTAQMSVSENLDYAHLGQYRGMIRKAYKELNIKIGDEERVEWNEDWDLHKPLFEYNNPYLRSVIKEKRTELQLSQKFWVDGYEWALHERFPFYFYLVNKKENLRLVQAVKGNVTRKTISENLQLIKVLKTDEVIKFFNLLKEYVESETDIKGFDKVDEILEQYGLEVDVRMKEFYYNLVKISRIVNMRKDLNETDYDLLRLFLEKTNCKLDVADTVDYNIQGPPNIQLEKQKDLLIEEQTQTVGDEFGLPQGEFE